MPSMTMKPLAGKANSVLALTVEAARVNHGADDRYVTKTTECQEIYWTAE